ncbi:MAG: hypothetical protein ABJA76_05260 [Mucilaginibacter sp.]
MEIKVGVLNDFVMGMAVNANLTVLRTYGTDCYLVVFLPIFDPDGQCHDVGY